MIRFFRSIRKKLASEGRVRKYLLYAIGEIILVVIGILIALQINNWNETRKLNKEEHEFLISLKKDFIENKRRLEETLYREQRVIRLSRSLLRAIQLEDNTVHPDSVAEWVCSGAKSWWRTEFVTGTYNAFESSGKIGILKNDDLKKLLAEFSSEVTYGFEDHDESLNYIVELNKIAGTNAMHLLCSFQYEMIGLSMNPAEKHEAAMMLLRDKSYAGLLATKTWLEINRKNYQMNLLQKIDSIQAILDLELEE